MARCKICHSVPCRCDQHHKGTEDSRKNKESLEYARSCQQIRDFFKTTKGKDLKVQSDANGKDLSQATQRGPEAIRALQSAQASVDDCFCEAGIIFYHKHKRYTVGKCKRTCSSPNRPEYLDSVFAWNDKYYE